MHAADKPGGLAADAHVMQGSIMNKIMILTFIIMSTIGAVEGKDDKPPKLEMEELKIFSIYPGAKDYNFFEWDENEGLSGYNGEIAVLVAKRLGLRAVPVAIDKKYEDSRIEMLQNGMVDICVQRFTITESRKEKIDFSEPYFNDGIGVIYRKEDEINSTEDFKDLKVLAFDNTTGKKFLQEKDIECEITSVLPQEYYPDPSKAVADGIVDVYLSDHSELSEAIKRHESLKLAPGILKKEKWGIGVKKGREDLLKAINWALREMSKERVFKELREKYRIVEQNEML